MKKSSLKIIVSFVAFIVFILISYGYFSFEVDIQTKYLGNGVYRQTYFNEFGDWKIIKTGTRDQKGNWHGLVTIESIHNYTIVDHQKSYTETVNYVNGNKHGKSTYVTPTGTKNFCYNMGKLVSCDGSNYSDEKALRQILTSFEILERKYPWYEFEYLSRNVSYKDSFERWMVAIENKLNTYTLNDQNFQKYFDEVLSSKEIKDSFKNIHNDYQILRFISQLDLLKENEFRSALVERYTQTKIPSIKILQNRYPFYIKTVESFGTISPEFKVFCDDFDKRIDKKVILPVSDPMFLDSLDGWMFQVLNEISEENDNMLVQGLRSRMIFDILSMTQTDIFKKRISPDYFGRSLSDTLPTHSVVTSLFLLPLLEADVVKLSIKDACFAAQKVPLVPEIVTNILSENTEGVKVRGLIVFDGNDPITKSGIVWDTVYNPELTPNNIINTGNKYDFAADIKGLVKGKRYFVRSYAVNKAGTAYGNTMEFIAGSVSSSQDTKLSGIDWKVYPNPADDQICITLKETIPVMDISVYSISGHIIFQKRYRQTAEINIASENWPPGTYTIVMNGSNIRKTKKVVIQR
jgi:hypothetical protein